VTNPIAALRGEVNKLASVPAFDPKPVEEKIAALRGEVEKLASVPAFDSKPLEEKIATLRGEVNKLASVPAFDSKPLEEKIAALRGEVNKLASVPAFDSKPLEDKIALLRGEIDKVASVPTLIKPRLLGQVYFGPNSSEVSESEQTKVKSWAESLGSSVTGLQLVGFADRLGSPEYNRSLSLRRASSVRNLFLKFGVENPIISSINGLGEDGAPVPTKDETPEPLDRTVMIIVYKAGPL
jgi:outer membrane protein OmpA-like peptidoglycan-associated protein